MGINLVLDNEKVNKIKTQLRKLPYITRACVK